jgi:hypothetical protein
MKKILEFNMPDDEFDFKMANNGVYYHTVLVKLDQTLRNYLKYGHTFETTDKALQSIRDELRVLMEDWGVNIND